MTVAELIRALQALPAEDQHREVFVADGVSGYARRLDVDPVDVWGVFLDGDPTAGETAGPPTRVVVLSLTDEPFLLDE